MAKYSLEKDETAPGGLKYTARTTARPFSAPLALLLALITATLYILQRSYAAVVPAVLLFYRFSAARVTEESLEIHSSIGIQLTSRRFFPFLSSAASTSKPSKTRSTAQGSAATRFTPDPQNISLVIGEGLQGCGGRYYLAVIEGKGEERKEVEVVFPTILPRLEDLQRVLKDAQPLLQ